MNRTCEATPLARKKEHLLMIGVVGLVVLVCAVALLSNDLPLLGAVAEALVLLSVLGLYLVEVQYAKELARALAKTVE